jgi:small subunit ribosomal protein S8
MTTDPIADMLTRIRNAIAASHATVILPYSKVKEGIARILKENSFINDYKVEESGQFKIITVDLKKDDGQPSITKLIRVSKPGRRIYAGYNEIPLVLGGRGMVILSTSNGIMAGREARQKGLGGELICKVW